MTWTLSCAVRLFILTIMLEWSRNVKRKFAEFHKIPESILCFDCGVRGNASSLSSLHIWRFSGGIREGLGTKGSIRRKISLNDSVAYFIFLFFGFILHPRSTQTSSCRFHDFEASSRHCTIGPDIEFPDPTPQL